jgi:uncharacterized membrane protein (TIGR02234 family)
MRRGLVVAVLLCLVGAGLLLLALSRTWITVSSPAVPPLPSRTLTVDGARLVPGVRALALLGLAGVAALPATRSWGRVAVGAVLAGAGLLSVALLLRALAERAAANGNADVHLVADEVPGFGGWPYVSLFGALLLVAAGVLTLVRGRSWSALGSSYDAPTTAKPTSAWDALDQGVDPTA